MYKTNHMYVYICTYYSFIVCRFVVDLQPKKLGGSGWTPPNGDAGIDSVISALAHETAEVATDPDTQSGYYQE